MGKIMKNDKEYIDNSLVLRKSNAIISAKYKSTILQNKLLAIGLTRLEIDNREDGNDIICARLYPGEIRNLLGNDDTNIYKKLKSVARTMTGNSMILEDGNGNFKIFAMITDVTYENKVFQITFHSKLKPFITGLKQNYTTLSLSTLISFEKNASYRIYELLKKEFYRSNPNENDGLVKVTYNLSEFKFMISLANADEAGVRNFIANKNGACDWDYLYDHVVKEKSYENWSDLKKRILLPAQKELKEKSDIRFDFVGRGAGGNKTKFIDFYIYPNKPEEQIRETIKKRAEIIDSAKEQATDYKQYELVESTYPELYRRYIGHNGLQQEDLDLLLQKASYNEEKVIKAIEMADKQPEINNYMGWLVRCIENEYRDAIGVCDGSKEKKAILDNMREISHSNETKERVWNKIQQNNDYENFLNQIGCSEQSLLAIYDTDERISLYTEFRLGKI